MRRLAASRLRWWRWTGSAVALFLLAVPSRADEHSSLPPPLDREIDFAKDVQPIFAASCYSCHGSQAQESGYRLDIKALALGRGDLGQPIVLGKSAESPLIQYVSGLDEEMLMPAEGEHLTAEQIGILRAWIDQGAQWPESSEELAGPERHWSLQPLIRPAVPTASHGQVHETIDRFVASALASRGMTYSEEADRRTLLRRLSFDLVGLPPTPEEMEAFLSDKSPVAYEKVVDRLLTSPRYGERWARHWIDLVHFAETHGNDEDRPRPNAWPYRDYLIQSLNEDKPYPRFVKEQVAGDRLYPDDPQATVALGFLAAGPWDESSQMGILDDTIDKKIAQVLDRDDIISTVMSTICSVTVHCARCHHHKFDPISQSDYYSLQAVFAGVDRAERPFDADPALHLKRLDLLRQKKSAEQLDNDGLGRDPALGDELALLEENFVCSLGEWTILTPIRYSSDAGATFTLQDDGSLLLSGTRADRDSYTLTFETDLQAITAIQLEVLKDASLPHEGPGRQDNGDLRLSEFKLAAGPAGDAATVPLQPIAIAAATADFSQVRCGVESAMDGKPETGWGIFPEVAKSHAAMFKLTAPLQVGGRARLVVTLEQSHGSGYLIGRPRVSVTTLATPSVELPTPRAIQEVLDIPHGQRTSEQQVELARYLLGQKLDRALAALPPARMVYAATSEFAVDGNFRPSRGPRAVHLLRRGDIHQPLDVAAPGALECIDGLNARFSLTDPADETERRACLAEWLVDPKNVLTWRSIANRLWHYHFGRGICETPNDLGKMGAPPSHRELLDWLASELRDGDGSLKSLHRMIVTSTAYRQSSRNNPQGLQLDADNRMLWRMNRQRMDAESIRDAVLSISGRLNWAMGGPSVKQFIESPGIHVTPVVDYQNFDVDDPGNHRRSVYRFLFRTLPDPFMESMDCPDASQLTPVRAQSVTALQALSMLNNRFVVRASEHTAARLARLSSSPVDQVRWLFRFALQRDPTATESERWTHYVIKYSLANACRLMFNTNEFIFVD